MYSKEIIRRVKQLRVDGSTLTEIVFKTGLSKSRAFDYIRNIPQSEYLVEKIRTNKFNARRIIAENRRGKSVKKYPFNRPEKWDSDLVNVISHFLFDGRITRVSCTYYNRSEVLVNLMQERVTKLLRVSDYKRYVTAEKVIRLSYFHVEIATFIRKKADELFTYIVSAPTEHKISFLRAFFDDEGSVTFNKKKRAVRGYQHSLEILHLIRKLLGELKISSTVDEKYFEISIYRKENLLKFQKYINFTKGLRVNGKRTNSIWKKDLEKREILKMALDSYL